VLGEYVRRVTLTVDFPEVDSLGPYRLLDPKRVCVEVSELSKPLSRADPDSSAGVSPHAQRELDADVLE
jgi:hypothetical protein